MGIGSGRNRVPMQLLDPKALHISNDEIKERAESEKKMSLGDFVFSMPENVKNDSIAKNKWVELISLYSGFQFITSADIDAIERYCVAYSEHSTLIKARREIIDNGKNEGLTSQQVSIILDESNIDHMLNKKKDLLRTLGNDIFLTPASRMRVVPSLQNDKKEPSKLQKLGLRGI